MKWACEPSIGDVSLRRAGGRAACRSVWTYASPSALHPSWLARPDSRTRSSPCPRAPGPFTAVSLSWPTPSPARSGTHRGLPWLFMTGARFTVTYPPFPRHLLAENAFTTVEEPEQIVRPIQKGRRGVRHVHPFSPLNEDSPIRHIALAGRLRVELSSPLPCWAGFDLLGSSIAHGRAGRSSHEAAGRCRLCSAEDKIRTSTLEIGTNSSDTATDTHQSAKCTCNHPLKASQATISSCISDAFSHGGRVSPAVSPVSAPSSTSLPWTGHHILHAPQPRVPSGLCIANLAWRRVQFHTSSTMEVRSYTPATSLTCWRRHEELRSWHRTGSAAHKYA
ncbi:hypothetical protein FA95DRAFT_916046 [Auriscalpium vulgare]|uniref:Uncharacterized protein n=1 Tax=Auriscalpium vulgare TaxID=40419 RepID=A0ACB8R7P7_9AGAM|nr:hypothetical protein FA95DRAFT_916046 [Auriscalpium vulgare]